MQFIELNAQAFVHKDYAASNDVIINPERGFYHQVEKITTQMLREYRQSGISLILKNYDLSNFKNKPLTSNFIKDFGNDMVSIRKAGLKIIVRFAYTFHITHPYGDAPPEIVMMHIDQLKNILKQNSDVILAFQAGFIGTWGEWYYTDYFSKSPGNITEKNWEDRRAVVNRLLQILPKDRMIQLRTPTFIRQMLQEDEFVAIAKENAYNMSDKSRLGLHNDCFVASYTDYGTYDNIAVEKAFLEENSKYTVVGGETCNKNSLSNCENSLKELERFHWTFLNQDYHQGVISEWKQQGCFEDIQKNLGYRYHLNTANLQTEAKPGGKVNFQLQLINTGWSNPVNEYIFEFVLKNIATGEIYTCIFDDDIRKWDLNEVHLLDFNAGIPANISQGNYAVYFRIKDKRLTLSFDPAYSIAFANDSIYDKNTGLNNLNHILNIKTNTAFDDYNGDTYFVKQGSIDTTITAIKDVKITQYNDNVLLYWANNYDEKNKAVKIQRKEADGSYSTISVQDPENKYFIDNDLEPDKTYSYKIQNIDEIASSVAKEAEINKVKFDQVVYLDMKIDGSQKDWDIVPPVMTDYRDGMVSLKLANSDSSLYFAIESPVINSFDLIFHIDSFDYKVAGDSLFVLKNGLFEYQNNIQLMSSDTFAEGKIAFQEINFANTPGMEGQVYVNDTILKDNDNQYYFLKFKTINPPSRFKVTPSVVTPYTKVKISWKLDSGVDGYILERSVGDDQHFEVLKQLNYNDSYYLNGDLDSSVVYYYRIFSFSGIVRSKYSDIIAIKTGNPDYINEIQGDNLLSASVYPNPFVESGTLKIKTRDNSQYRIELYDSNMRRVRFIYQGKIRDTKRIKIDKGNLKKGIYFIVISNKYIRKLLKLTIF